MGKPYSLDFRKRVVAAVVTGGLSCNEAGKQFGVAVSTAIGWVRRQRETGSIAPGKMGGHLSGCWNGSRRAISPCGAGCRARAKRSARLARYFVAEFWGHSVTLCPTSSYFSERAGPLPTRKQR